MTDQATTDAVAEPTPHSAIDPAAVRKPSSRFGRGLVRDGAILGGIMAVAVWGLWVTHELTGPRDQRIVTVRLSDLVGSYVEAQRFSDAPPERVKAEMTAFMKSLDDELQRRSASGQVVLVGEAVLSKNVDDVTDSIRTAVFSSGVAKPKLVTPEQLQERLRQMAAPQQPLPPEPELPVAGTGSFAPQMAPAPFGPAAPQPVAPSVTTFGGPNGDGR